MLHISNDFVLRSIIDVNIQTVFDFAKPMETTGDI